MMVAMDLDSNSVPLPEEDEILEGCIEQYCTTAPNLERIETPASMLVNVDIAHRENEERRKRLRQEQCSDDHRVPMQMITESYDTSKLPAGWLDCPCFGEEVLCVIPSKVPLGESYNHYVPPGKRYSVKQVIQKQRLLGRKLRLVIDLTNTSRYYPPSDLEKEGIKHVRTPCKGRDSIPDRQPFGE